MRSAERLLLMVLISQAAGPDVATAPAAPRNTYGKIELVWDRWGVPHVFSGTDAGAMYGLGHADQLNPLFAKLDLRLTPWTPASTRFRQPSPRRSKPRKPPGGR